jgi:hypothetical protein
MQTDSVGEFEMRLFKRKDKCFLCGAKKPYDELMYVKILNVTNPDNGTQTIQEGLACMNCQPIRHGSHLRMGTLNTINSNKCLK